MAYPLVHSGWRRRGPRRGFAWPRSSWRSAPPRAATPPAPNKLFFEGLEPRLLLAADPLTYTMGAADLTLFLQDDAGTPTLHLQEGGGDVATKALADTSTVVITGTGGADTFIVDFSEAFDVPMAYNAGRDSNDDKLVLASATADSVTHVFTSANNGSVDVDLGGGDTPTITYTGLSPITDNLDAADRVFTFGASADVVTLSGGGSLDNRISSSPATSELVDFLNPTNSLTVNTAGAGDTINVGAMDSGLAVVVSLNTGGAGDTINTRKSGPRGNRTHSRRS